MKLYIFKVMFRRNVTTLTMSVKVDENQGETIGGRLNEIIYEKQKQGYQFISMQLKHEGKSV